MLKRKNCMAVLMVLLMLSSVSYAKDCTDECYSVLKGIGSAMKCANEFNAREARRRNEAIRNREFYVAQWTDDENESCKEREESKTQECMQRCEARNSNNNR